MHIERMLVRILLMQLPNYVVLKLNTLEVGEIDVDECQMTSLLVVSWKYKAFTDPYPFGLVEQTN